MASGRKPTARNRTGNVDKNAAGKNSVVTSLALPNIGALIADGEILSVCSAPLVASLLPPTDIIASPC